MKRQRKRGKTCTAAPNIAIFQLDRLSFNPLPCPQRTLPYRFRSGMGFFEALYRAFSACSLVRSLSSTYHRPCRSSQLLRRRSAAVHATPEGGSKGQALHEGLFHAAAAVLDRLGTGNGTPLSSVIISPCRHPCTTSSREKPKLHPRTGGLWRVFRDGHHQLVEPPAHGRGGHRSSAGLSHCTSVLAQSSPQHHVVLVHSWGVPAGAHSGNVRGTNSAPLSTCRPPGASCLCLGGKSCILEATLFISKGN